MKNILSKYISWSTHKLRLEMDYKPEERIRSSDTLLDFPKNRDSKHRVKIVTKWLYEFKMKPIHGEITKI